MKFWKDKSNSAKDERKEKTELLEKLDREGLKFEELLITLATGTLVLSVTLLKSSVTLPSQQWFLVGSWIALVLSVMFGLTDRLLYIFGLSAHPAVAEHRDEEDDRSQQYWAWSERVSWMQIIAFFVGIVLLLLFAILHINVLQ